MAKIILIVEDDQKSMKLFEEILHSQGYKTLKSVDGSDVIQLVEGQRPDLILMDVKLPKVSGLEITTMLKSISTYKDIPIICISAHAMVGDKKEILSSGCDDYMSKPISVPDFLILVSNYLNN